MWGTKPPKPRILKTKTSLNFKIIRAPVNQGPDFKETIQNMMQRIKPANSRRDILDAKASGENPERTNICSFRKERIDNCLMESWLPLEWNSETWRFCNHSLGVSDEAIECWNMSCIPNLYVYSKILQSFLWKWNLVNLLNVLWWFRSIR